MNRVYIAGGKRCYIGIENGIYRHVPAEILGARVLKKTLLGADMPELVIAGNGVGAGGNIARLMTLEAGLAYDVPAYTVDVQCGSGLMAITSAYEKIALGAADYIVAGGFESSSTAPVRRYNKNHPDYERYGGADSSYKAAKFSPGYHDQNAMIRGAERTAVSYGIKRNELDRWVLRSHRLAASARDENKLAGILAEAVEGKNRDSGIRDRINQRLLDKLPLLLSDGHVLTAANTCLTNDGAAFVRIVSDSYAESHNIKPQFEIINSVTVGTNPEKSPVSAIAAVDRLLNKNKMTDRDISIFEINEAFAVIDELFIRKYPYAEDRYNVYGGALAYGHPYGASGAVILLHACTALKEADGEYAAVGIAAAGGVGQAVLIKNCN